VTTKALLEARMNNMLSASAPATHWAAASLDEALTTTIEEYSRAKPYTAVFTTSPVAREVSVSLGLTLFSIVKVWYPYTAATPEYPPAWIDYDFWWDSGAPKLLLHTDAAPDGTKVARVWYNSIHTLNGLNGAAATTWQASDDSIIVTGACGYAFLERSSELDETIQNMAVSTPNYGALAQIFLDRFHAMLYVNSSRGVIL
jgi:hypothetical protein